MGSRLYLFDPDCSPGWAKYLGHIASREDEQGTGMLAQGARDGFLIPGHQAPGTRRAGRDNQCDGTRGKPHDAT